jgi:hypothetical protein
VVQKCDARSFHWKSFTTALLKRFHDEEDDDLYNKFVHLKQKGSVNDYTHEWEVLATRQSGFTDEQLLKMYICGLKDYIRSEIKLWNPKSIEDARHATKLIELKDKFNRPSFAGPEASNRYSNEKPNKYSTDKSNPDKKWVNKCRYCGDNWFSGHICDNKKLYTCKAEKESDTSSSESERENKKKNNCRKCGENWTPGHRCEDKSLRYFRIVDGKQVEVPKTEDEITIAYNADSDHDEIPQKTSLASISCVQKNRNEENKLQREKITPKNQVHQPIAKYIPPHLRKDKSQSPRKEESKSYSSIGNRDRKTTT